MGEEEMELQTSAEWAPIDNLFYRKFRVYSMQWDVELFKYDLIGAPYGGPVALTRSLDSHIPDTMPTIEIFSSSGVKISSFLWDKGRIVKMGWSMKEELVIVMEDGTVMIFSLFGELVTQFSMGKEVQQQRVLDCQIWGSGVVVLTNQRRFFATTSFETPRTRPLRDPGLTEDPTCWIVIEPRFSPTKQVQVLVATGSDTILVVTRDQVEDKYLSHGPFYKMALSRRGQTLACFTADGSLWITQPDLKGGGTQKIETQTRDVPKQMVWCGADSIVCLWERNNDNLVVMFGPRSQSIKYVYRNAVHLISEIDGVRIISQNDCEFWQLVPNVTVKTLQIGSLSKPARLFAATQCFEERSPLADAHIRAIKDDLAITVQEVIEASGYEFFRPLQRQLLKSAAFGKCFVEFYSPENFVKMCKDLRVLNSIRDENIGIPMTIDQYNYLSMSGVLERLLNRHQHLLAFQICQYRKTEPDVVLTHWACSKVKTDQPDRIILQEISEKLKSIPGISYAGIASTAYKYGKSTLATQLLDFEPRAADQVPLLISMAQDELALKKAIESGDTDLMYLVLLHLKRTNSVEQTVKMILRQPEALDLFIAYCKEQEPELLPEIYATGQLGDRALIHKFSSAFQQNSLPSQIEGFEKISQELAPNKEKGFERAVAQEQAALLLLQKSLDNSLKKDASLRFVGMSVSDTLFHLFVLGATKQARNVRETFTVPDNRFWWIKIRALASIPNWEALHAFSKDKKSPIGYAPFAEVCLEKDEIEEAVKYIPRIADPLVRVDYFIRVGAFVQAAVVATKEIRNCDPEVLERIWRECKKEDPEVLPKVEELLQ